MLFFLSPKGSSIYLTWGDGSPPDGNYFHLCRFHNGFLLYLPCILVCISQPLRHGCAVPPPLAQGRLFYKNVGHYPRVCCAAPTQGEA